MREIEIGGRQPYGGRQFSPMRCFRGEKRTILLKDLEQYEALGWKETARPRSRVKYVIVNKKRVEATKATIVTRSRKISNDRTIQEIEDNLEAIERKKGPRAGILIALFVIFMTIATCWLVYANNLNGEMVTDALTSEYSKEIKALEKTYKIKFDTFGEANLVENYGCPANASWEELSYNEDVGKLVQQYEAEMQATCGEEIELDFFTEARREKVVQDCEGAVFFEKAMGYLNPNFWIIKCEGNWGLASKIIRIFDKTYYFSEEEHRSDAAYRGWAVGLCILFYFLAIEVIVNKAIRMRVFKSKKQYYISEAAARVDEMRETYARSAALKFNNILPEDYEDDMFI